MDFIFFNIYGRKLKLHLFFFYEISNLLKVRTDMQQKKGGGVGGGELKPSTLSFKTKEGIEEMWMVPDYLH